MIGNYLRATLRILAKDKLYTVINSFGLAIGLATCFLIYSWVQFETSYDTWFPDSNRTFRVVTKWDESEERGIASTYPMVRTRVLSQFPEVVESTRLFDEGFLGSKTKITIGDKVFTDSKFFYGDSTTLSVFPFRITEGNPTGVLNGPNAVIVTQATARKFFGDQNPIGKIIEVGAGREFVVTAVIENIPPNAHFHFDLLASMASHPWIKQAENTVWSGVVFHTYVRLKEGASAADLEKKIAGFMDRFPDDPQQIGKNLDLRLQPIQDIHLKSNMRFELEGNGNSTYVYLFVTIAMLVLVVALINYINLATARHTTRFKEVGVRKVVGASRSQLIVQFLTESFAITSFAIILAVLMVEMARPLLLSLSGQNYFSSGFAHPRVLLSGVVISVCIGMLTGVFPAWGLSSFQPVRLFKVSRGPASGGLTIRKVLVVSQFAISIILTICTVITYKQIRYLQDARLGYDPDHTLVLNIGFREVREKYLVLKNELSNHPSIIGATATSQLPTDIQTGENIDVSRYRTIGVNCVSVDPDFFRVMSVPVKNGDQMIAAIQASDSVNNFVLNESALKAIGWNEEDALNRQISIRHGNQLPGSIRGIVKDFHFQSLHHVIEPLVLEFNPDSYQYLLVKVKAENLDKTIRFISSKWEAVAGGIPFDYKFLDQEYDNLYKTEKRSSALFIAFSIVALLVSLLGLFGLSSFAVERRTKEIGLRKILGADNARILVMISRDFILLLLIAFSIAVPAGYYFTSTWMSNFAFRTSIGPGPFLLAGVANVLLALMTLSYHSIRISRTDPVDTLRYE